MSSPTYPLPTLAVSVLPQGPSAPSFAEIIASLTVSIQGIYGSDVVLTPDQQDTQLISLIAQAISDSNDATIAGINNFNPAYSQGSGQDTTYLLNGIQRQVSTFSTMPANVVGVAGTEINAPNNIVQDNNGNLWTVPDGTVIPNAGTIAVTLICQTPGAVAAIAQTMIPYTPVLGWQSTVSTASATLGAPVESDGQFRQRQQISTNLPSQTPLQKVAAALANLPGISRSIVYENPTYAFGTGSETPPLVPTQPPHSVCCVVEGSATDQAIAQSIEASKSPGTSTSEGMSGITTVTVEDPSGVPININFFILENVPIYVSVTVQPLTGWVASTATAIQAAIVAFVNALAIGQDVYYNSIFGPASLYRTDLDGTFAITALTIGLAPAPIGVVNLTIDFNQAATTVAADVVVTVS